jgi:long-chain acyl-CoA synthetase
MKEAQRPWVSHYVSPTKAEIAEIKYKNLAEMIRDRAQKLKKQKAFVTCMPNGMNGTLTYAEVDQLSDAFAIYLREEVKLSAGDKVALQMPNCLAFPIAAFGILKAGCVLVNTNPLYSSREMKHQFENAEVKALIIINMFVDKYEAIQTQVPVKKVIVCKVSELFPSLVSGVIELIQKYWNQVIPNINVEHTSFSHALKWGKKNFNKEKLEAYLKDTNGESIAVLQYTGGTTGVSKGAMLTHKNLLANRAQILELLQDKIDFKKECVLTALPLYHIFAFSVNLLVFYSVGGTNILIPSPRPLSNLKRAFENYPISWLT